MTSATAFLDSLITEYLTFRGFTGTSTQFNNDVKNDKDRGFCVERIVEEIVALISRYELSSLHQLWKHLDQRIFSHLTQTQSNHADKLEDDLYKLYLSNCVQNNQKERTLEFFDLLGAELHHRETWSEWFAINYVVNARDQEPFRMYFTKSWQQTYFVVLHNFLSIAFHQCDVPVLYSCLTATSDGNKSMPNADDSFTKISSALLHMRIPSDTDLTRSTEVMDDFASIASMTVTGDKSSSKSLGSRLRQKLVGGSKSSKK